LNESDGKSLTKKSITWIKIPLVKEGEVFVKAKKKRKRKDTGSSRRPPKRAKKTRSSIARGT
jgi:hypothetical protein